MVSVISMIRNPIGSKPGSAAGSAAAAKRTLWILAALLGLTTAFQATPLVFGRQTATVTITDNYAPRECRRHRSLLHGPKHRSTASGFPGMYCGLIMTDHGSFVLPQSGRFNLFRTSREELFDILSTGCTYKVVVAGYGPRLKRGYSARNIGNRTLLSATPVGACPAS